MAVSCLPLLLVLSMFSGFYFYSTSGETILGGAGCSSHLYSTAVCKDIRCSTITRAVHVRGPYDFGMEDADVQFSYQFRYRVKDASFVEDCTTYTRTETCQICCPVLPLDRVNKFHLTWKLLQKPMKKIVTMDLHDVVEPGVYLVTRKDVVQSEWRRKFKRPQVSQPTTWSDEHYPEAWRCPKAVKVPSIQHAKSVCRVTAMAIMNNDKWRSRRQVLDPADLILDCVIYVRPADVGVTLACPYEVVKTDQVVRLTGRDILSVVEVHHASAHIDLQGWIGRGAFTGRPRFHFTYEIDADTRTIQPSPPESPGKSLTPPALPESKLATLELYAGCGGLALGLQASGLTETTWAVEKDPEAAKVFAANFPNCKVYTEDVEMWLDNLKSNRFGEKLPKPGEVDLIAGGPPCQGYSRLNRHKSTAEAVKKRAHSLVFVAACTHLRPKFAIFENVAEFVRAEKGANLQGVLAEFIKSGYQVRFTIMRAAAHGVPQQRQRTIILAARLGQHLPNFPQEEYFLPGRVPNITLGAHTVKVSMQGTVMYGPVGVCTAIGDLENVRCVNGRKRTSAYLESHSALQAKLRKGCAKVSRHAAIHPVSELDVHRLKFIPQGGDWRQIPNKVILASDGRVLSGVLHYKGFGSSKTMCACTPQKKCARKRRSATTIPWCLAHTASNNGNWKGAYGRLECAGRFPTIITNPGPLKANGRLIHPHKDRFISIREAARAQTFPDRFQLHSNNATAVKQIGNAVPCLLAEAIGRAFLQRR